MADISVTDFLGAWANAINNELKYMKHDDALLQKFDSFISVPATYRVPASTSVDVCNETFTLDVYIESNTPKVRVKNKTTGTTVATANIKNHNGNDDFVTLYKLTDKACVACCAVLDNTYSYYYNYLVKVNPDTGDLTTIQNGIYSWSYSASSGWNPFTGSNPDCCFYKNIFDSNSFVLTERYYDCESSSVNVSQCYQYEITTVNWSDFTLKDGGKSGLYQFILRVGSDRNGKISLDSAPITTFYSCSYEKNGVNVVVSKGANSDVIRFFPYSMNGSKYFMSLIAFGGTQLLINNGWITDDGSNILGLYPDPSKGKFYAVTFKEGTYPYTPDWFDSTDCFTIWEFTPATYSKSNLKISDLIAI